MEPGLYVVATPIGNLGDLSPRAAETLRNAALVLVEDTRVTARLLAHAGARVPMRRYDDHSTDADRAQYVERLGNEAIALVSDAGTPLISDPGYKLVRAAREAGHQIHTVPGPCAAIAALTLAGLPTDRFLFLGFLPAKAKARADAIAEIADVRATLVFYESGSRLGDALLALATQLGRRDAAVARELTKLHEECVTGTLPDLAARYADTIPKGEIVVVVGPPREAVAEEADDATLDAALREAMADKPVAQAAKAVAKRFGRDRHEVYARALALKERA